MAYRLASGESLAQAVRRIADEELTAALHGLANPGALGLAGTIHDVRKRCKKLRALARLVRPGLGGSRRRTNDLVRDAAGELSALRDADALLATFDRLVAANPEGVPSGGLTSVRDWLETRAAASHDGEIAGRMGRASALLGRARDEIAAWPLPEDVDRCALDGLELTYRRGRAALAASRRDPVPELLHEWRKRTKDLWYHARVLAPVAPSAMLPLQERLGDLAEALGDDHDLAVLGDVLGVPAAGLGEEEVRAAVTLAEGQRQVLQAGAWRLGETVWAERPSAFRARIAAYLDAWNRLGPERPVGPIESQGAARA